jgi:hypothetical protein
MTGAGGGGRGGGVWLLWIPAFAGMTRGAGMTGWWRVAFVDSCLRRNDVWTASERHRCAILGVVTTQQKETVRERD